MLPKLLEQIPPEELISTVTADGAYDTRPCHAAIAARTATAIIPTRRNGRPWRETTPGAQARNEVLRASRRFGCRAWKRWSGHHQRSLIKARMRCLKLLGERLTSRTSSRQTARPPDRQTARPPSFRSAPPSSTASQPLVRPRLSVLHKTNGDQGELVFRPSSATEPVDERIR